MHSLLNVRNMSDMLTIASFVALVVMNNFKFSTSNVNIAFLNEKLTPGKQGKLPFFLLFGIAKMF